MPPTSSSTRFSGIFISYRRDDSSGHAGRLFDNLVNHFGRERIFMDIDTIEPGEDFVTIIEDAVASCDLLIAVIGQNWLSGTTGDVGRLDDPNDFVRVEIATALDRDIRVIPVLVQRATMPLQRDLPDNLTKLARRNAIELSDFRWQNDVEQLIRVMDRVLAQREQERLAKVAHEAEVKRQREVEDEERRTEEKRRLLSEAEARRKAAEQTQRETEEKQRLALAEKRRVEEQRQKEEERQRTHEEQQRAVEKARREAEERARVALAEQQRAEEESRRRQRALNEKKIEPVAAGLHPNPVPVTHKPGSPGIAALHDAPSFDKEHHTRRKRVIIMAASAFVGFVLIASVIGAIAILQSGKTDPPRSVHVADTASPVPTVSPSPIPTPSPTPDRPAFQRGLKAYIKKRLAEGEAEILNNRRVIYGDLNADGVDEAIISYCANLPSDPSLIKHCEVVVFREDNGVLKYLTDFFYEGQNGQDETLLADSIKDLKIVCHIVTYQVDGEGAEAATPHLKGRLNLVLDGDKLKLSR